MKLDYHEDIGDKEWFRNAGFLARVAADNVSSVAKLRHMLSMYSIEFADYWKMPDILSKHSFSLKIKLIITLNITLHKILLSLELWIENV